MHFEGKWTLLGESELFRMVFGEKEDLFTCTLGKSGLLNMLFVRKAGLEEPEGMFPAKILKNMIVNYAFRDIIIKLHSIFKL